MVYTPKLISYNMKNYFSKKIVVDEPQSGLSTFVMPTSVKDVITFAGSLPCGTLYSPRQNSEISALAAGMLDKGTKNKDKFEVSDILESVGAEINFFNTAYHVHFTGYCLKSDLETVLCLLCEQLRTPLFLEKELSTLKKRLVGNLERSKEDTKKQATIGLLRELYPPDHPNYALTTDEKIERVSLVKTKEIKTFHKKTYRLGGFNFSAAGDVNPDTINKLLKEQFSGWKKGSDIPYQLDLKARPVKSKECRIPIPDKQSIDMYLGQAIGINRRHKDYYPLKMAIYVLGGNFSARLMQTIRDEAGLTYGIGASLSGTGFGSDGYWSTWATFAPDLLKKGKGATHNQIQEWYNKGITEKELKEKKTTLTGAYQVGLDSTGGLAARILSNAEQGEKTEHLDKYPEIIKNISLDKVNKTIKKYIKPKQLTFVAAGTFDD